MVDPVEMAERHARVLAELTELGLAFARDAQRDAEAAETPEQRAQQALVFQRVSRAVRQTVALEAKLVRDAVRVEREEAAIRRRDDREQTIFRQGRLKRAVEALVWRETENLEDEADDFDDVLDAAVTEEAEAEAFLSDEFGDQVARVIARMGFEITAEGVVRRKAPEPPPPQAPATEGPAGEPPLDPDAYWRSSA